MMNIKQLKIILIFAVSTNLAALQSVQANPKGATVINGQVSFSQPDLNTLVINNSPNAIINWQQFDISINELTRFVQQGGSSAVLNRVVSGNASEILGKLQSNGKVFLINPNGLVIGQNAMINTAGFIGSTLNISNEDFLNGRLHFEGQNAGDIDNQGFIRAGINGDILLIAPNITNGGVLQVDGGNILLAAGESITISSLDDADISFEVQSPSNSITNLGQVIADNGAASLFAGTLTHTGSISANGITQDAAGNIRLVAQDTNWIEGEVIATGKQGGDIQLLGEQVGLAGNAMIDASGTDGGGQVLIGGDYQGLGDVQTARASYVGEDVQIKVDAIEKGDGGEVIVWGNESTRMYGSIYARGGALSGDGGFIETSGGWLDLGSIVPDASAASGEGGTWLIDPNNIDIIVGTGSIPGPGPIFTSGGISATLDVDLIKTALEGGNDVVVQTGTVAPDNEAGDINWGVGVNLDLDDVVNQTLTLSAHNNVNISGTLTRQGGISQTFNLVVVADSDTNGSGGFTLANTANLDFTLGAFGGTLDVTAPGNIVIDGIVDTNGGTVDLTSTTGSISQGFASSINADTIGFTAATGISIAGLINTGSIGTDSLTLDSSTSILQAVSSGITTSNLVATSSGDMDYQGANSISNLNALVNNGSNLTFNNSAPLTIDVINAVGGAVTLNNSGAVNQAGAIGGIVATSLDVTGNSGDITLNDVRNDVDSITALTSSAVGSDMFFSYTDADDLEVQDVSVANVSTSPPDGAFLDITSGGDMSLNGNINTASATAGNSGITLNAQNGSNIIYQNGTITTDTLNLQTDNNPTSVGAAGTAVNPIHTAANATFININHGSNGGSGPPNSGGDLFLLNNTGDMFVSSYMTASPSILQIENNAGDIDLSGVSLIDSAGLTTDILSASNIRLVANGALSLPAFLGTRPPATESRSGVASRLAATSDIYLEGQNLSIDESIDAAGDIMLVSSLGSLFIQNTAAVTSTTGNVELRSDAFNINGNVTAQNQVVVREFSAAGGLEINDATPTSGFATLTTTELAFLDGTNLGIVLGNDLAHSGAKAVQVMSDIDSSMINGPALTLDTTNTGGGSSLALVSANVDFTTGNENLIFTGNGNAIIQSSPVTSGGVTVDTGTGNLSSSVNQFTILGTGSAPEINQVMVKTNNSDITGNLVVSSGTQVGESVSFEGNNLTVHGNVTVVALDDSAEINFSGNVVIDTALSVDVIGGTTANASASLVGGNIDITAGNTTILGGDGDNATAKIASTAGGTTTIDSSSGSITLRAGAGVDADALIIGGDGVGVVNLSFSSCQGCNNQLVTDPNGNGVSDSGIFGNPSNASRDGNLDPIPELDGLFNNFITEYVVAVNGDDEDESLSVCR